MRASVLSRVLEGDAAGFAPARDVDAVRLVDLEESVRLDPDARDLKSTLERTAGPALGALLRTRHGEAGQSSGGLTLRQLAGRWDVTLDGGQGRKPTFARAGGGAR